MFVIHHDKGLPILSSLYRSEQPHQVGQRKLIQHLTAINCRPDCYLFRILHRLQFFINGILDNQAGYEGLGLLANTIDTAECYVQSVRNKRLKKSCLHQVVIPCCSTLLFHHKSTHMTRDAMVRLRPTPPHLREAIIIFVSSSSRKEFMALSRASWVILP